MKSTSLVFCLLLIFAQAGKNPDLELKLTDRLSNLAAVVILNNLSTTKVYTVSIRRREFRWRYRVYKIGDTPGDTVTVGRDTLMRFTKVVVPPRKWRYLGVNFEGESTLMLDRQMRVDTGYVSTFRFKIMDSTIGGDVEQVFKRPEPFAVKQPFDIFGDGRFYSRYQGIIKSK